MEMSSTATLTIRIRSVERQFLLTKSPYGVVGSSLHPRYSRELNNSQVGGSLLQTQNVVSPCRWFCYTPDIKGNLTTPRQQGDHFEKRVQMEMSSTATLTIRMQSVARQFLLAKSPYRVVGASFARELNDFQEAGSSLQIQNVVSPCRRCCCSTPDVERNLTTPRQQGGHQQPRLQ